MKKTKAIADHYGKKHQTIKAIEELAELIQALAKGDTDNIKEEIADVRVMLEQIEYLYGISDDAITLRMCAKLWRQHDDGTWSHTPFRKDGRVTECRV